MSKYPAKFSPHHAVGFSRVTIWCDSASDPSAPQMIVDIEDDAGTKTVAAYGVDTRGQVAAWRKARDVAQERGLPIYEVGDDGDRVLALPPSVSEAAAALGRSRSDKKAAASRANGAKGGRPRKAR